MLLAILSYPKNYHITQVAIKHAIKYIPNITKTAIIWDDTHTIKPSMPIHEALTNCISYNWSALHNEIHFDGNNWLEQQLIKLHADLLLNEDEFILMDGDLIINQSIDPVNIIYSNNLPRMHGNYNHIREILGLGTYDFSTNPFMYYKAQWLKNIRMLSETNSHMKLTTKFKTTPSLREWNLMAHYVLDVLKLPKRIEYFHRRSINGPNFYRFYNSEENFVCDGSDNIDLAFYESEGIFIDTALMSKLNY